MVMPLAEQGVPGQGPSNCERLPCCSGQALVEDPDMALFGKKLVVCIHAMPWWQVRCAALLRIKVP